MELRDYLHFLARHRRILLLVATLFTLITGAITLLWPTRYTAELTVYVQRVPEKPAAGDYTYDGFYAQQAAEAYTDTVEGFLQSRDIIRQALQTAKLSTDAKEISRVERRLRVSKIAPQLIDISLTLEAQDKASALVKAIAQTTTQRVRTLNQQQNQAAVIKLVSTEPLENTVKPWLALNLTLGFLAGLFIATGGLLLQEYLRAN